MPCADGAVASVGSKAGVSAMLAVKMVFGDMNDILSYPPLSNSTEERLKFSKLTSLHAVRFTVERGLEGGFRPRFQLAKICG